MGLPPSIQHRRRLLSTIHGKDLKSNYRGQAIRLRNLFLVEPDWSVTFGSGLHTCYVSTHYVLPPFTLHTNYSIRKIKASIKDF